MPINDPYHLYICNIPYDAQESELEALFNYYGNITEIKIFKDSISNRPLGRGFIAFSHFYNESMSMALLVHETNEVVQMNGRKLRISEAVDKRKMYRFPVMRGGDYPDNNDDIPGCSYPLASTSCASVQKSKHPDRDNITGQDLQPHQKFILNECSICFSYVVYYDKLEAASALSCGHVFHQDCIEKWFENAGSRKCPNCLQVTNVALRKLILQPMVVGENTSSSTNSSSQPSTITSCMSTSKSSSNTETIKNLENQVKNLKNDLESSKNSAKEIENSQSEILESCFKQIDDLEREKLIFARNVEISRQESERKDLEIETYKQRMSDMSSTNDELNQTLISEIDSLNVRLMRRSRCSSSSTDTSQTTISIGSDLDQEKDPFNQPPAEFSAGSKSEAEISKKLRAEAGNRIFDFKEACSF